MKKVISIIIFIFVICMCTNIASATFEVQNSVTPKQIKVGDTITYTITANENVIATNFEISYANDKFELVGSDTSNLSVAKKNDKIACIYADMSGTGTKEFKIKFKAIAETDNATFSISDYKFRVADNDNSYTNLSIATVNNVCIKNDVSSGSDVTLSITEPTKTPTAETTSDGAMAPGTRLPQTGKTETLIFTIIILAITGAIFKIKSDKLNKILRG